MLKKLCKALVLLRFRESGTFKINVLQKFIWYFVLHNTIF